MRSRAGRVSKPGTPWQVLHGWAERPKRTRDRVYGTDVAGPLIKIWAALDSPAGKRLAPFMAEVIEASERHGELELSPEVREAPSDLGLHDRSPARSAAPTAAGEGAIGLKPGVDPEAPDPDPDLRRVGRGQAGLLRGRPGPDGTEEPPLRCSPV